MSTPSSHTGRFVWRELISADVPAARDFYGALFGWDAAEQDMGMPTPYVMFQHGDETVGGAMAPMMDGVPSHWLDYITVDDVDAALDRAVALGGQKLTDPMDIPGIGRFAVVRDPNGAAFSLFTGTPGATDTERRPPAHTFCWSQLMTRDLDATVAFYTGLLGWTAEPMGDGAVVFRRGEAMRASAMSMPEEAQAPSHWLQYVAVEDTDAAWDKALSLGARGFHGPQTMPGMGRFAVLADPTGAPFALWKDLSQPA